MSQPPNQPPYAPPPGGEPPQQPGYGPGPYQGGYGQGWAPAGYEQGQPSYPPPGAYGGAPAPEPAGPGFGARLGSRVRTRPEPRLGISLAAAGVGIAVIGILVWSFGYLVQGIHIDTGGRGGVQGDGRRFLGFGLALVLTLAGYALVIVRRTGPLATAAAVGAALGVPVALIFLTLDFSSPGSDGLPLNIDVVYMLSVIIYLASYFLVPGLRGRAFLLGLAALEFAGYIEFKVASGSVARASASIFGSSNVDASDFGTGGLTAVALIFGLAYLGLAALLDTRGLHGAATALVVAGTFTVVAGIGYGVLTFKQIGTGIELVVLGAALSFYGARFGRRFTTWFWTFAITVGVGLVVQKALPDSPAGSGITLIVVGLVVVVAAQLLSTMTHEAPDVVETAATGPTPTAAGAGPGYERRH